jgi:hypothetical protein
MILANWHGARMEWSGRPAPPRVMLRCGERRTEHRHFQQPGMTICHDGIDSGKNSFHLVGPDRRGAIGCGRSGYGAS